MRCKNCGTKIDGPLIRCNHCQNILCEINDLDPIWQVKILTGALKEAIARLEL